MKVSVVIPVLNERENLPLSIRALGRIPEIDEIVVVDGGSTDGTREWLAGQPNIRVVDGPKGRGNQLNAGGQAASGDILVFLHADSRLPPDGIHRVREVLADAKTVGGGFLVEFGERRPRILRLVASGINFRTRVFRSATGDQALFARKTSFQAADGFAHWPLFEDVDFVHRLKRLGRFAVLPSPVVTSARRYVAFGVVPTVFLMYSLRIGYWFGVSPVTLHRWFGDVRSHLADVKR